MLAYKIGDIVDARIADNPLAGSVTVMLWDFGEPYLAGVWISIRACSLSGQDSVWTETGRTGRSVESEMFFTHPPHRLCPLHQLI